MQALMKLMLANTFYVYVGFFLLGAFLLFHSRYLRRRGVDRATYGKGSWLDAIKTLYWALFIALFFKSFLFQPFNIPSGSMKPTLLIGDYLIVSKYSYGYSNHSFPLGPKLFDGRIFASQPKRGDIVVMHVPGQTIDKDTYIKRLIGLPGDKIQVKKGVLYINNEAMPQEEFGTFYDKDMHEEIRRLVETLPNGVRHYILSQPRGSDPFYRVDPDNTDIYEVPQGHYFMMGDNRNNSSDSRFPMLGFVAKENLIGRAEIILFASDQSWNPKNWDYKRFFTLLR